MTFSSVACQRSDTRPVWCCDSKTMRAVLSICFRLLVDEQICGSTFPECKDVSSPSPYKSVMIGLLISCVCITFYITSCVRWTARRNQLPMNSVYQPVAIINSTTIHLADDELPPSYEQAISEYNQYVSRACR
jgi:hypothetical protein